MARGLAQAKEIEPSSIKVVVDEWPLVVFRMPPLVDVKVGLELGREVDKLLRRREEFVMVVDSRRNVDMPSDARKAVADWEKSQDAPLRTFAKAAAIVMPNRTMFAVVGLISWLNPPPYPKKCFLDEAEAKAWAREKLSRR